MATWDKLSIAIEQVLLFSISFEQAVNLQAYLEIIMGVRKLLLNYVYYLCLLVAENYNVMSSFLVHLPRFSHWMHWMRNWKWKRLRLKMVCYLFQDEIFFAQSEWQSICIYLKRCGCRFHFRWVWTGFKREWRCRPCDEWVHIPLSCRAMKTKGMVFRYTWVYSNEDTMAHTRRPVVTS